MIRPPLPSTSKNINLRSNHGWAALSRIWRFINPIHLSNSDWWFLMLQQKGRLSGCRCSSNILQGTHCFWNIHTFGHSILDAIATGALAVLTWTLSHKHVQEHSFETIYILKDHPFRDFVSSCDRTQGCEESTCAEISAATQHFKTIEQTTMNNT